MVQENWCELAEERDGKSRITRKHLVQDYELRTFQLSFPTLNITNMCAVTWYTRHDLELTNFEISCDSCLVADLTLQT